MPKNHVHSKGPGGGGREGLGNEAGLLPATSRSKARGGDGAIRWMTQKALLLLIPG